MRVSKTFVPLFRIGDCQSFGIFWFCFLIWSVSAALHAVARGALSFSVFRLMLGIGEAGNWPGATKANAEWFPVKERALAQGIFNSGASIGDGDNYLPAHA